LRNIIFCTYIFTCSDDEDNVSEYQAEMTPFISKQQTAVIKSRPIPVSELWSFVATKKISTDGSLKAEYLVSFVNCLCGK